MGESAKETTESVDPRPKKAAPPPELLGVTRDEFRALYELTWAFAHRLTKSKALADELTQTAFELLYTTRRWDPKGTTELPRHLLGIVKSVLHHRRAAKAPHREAEAEARFARELGDSVPSAEAAHLDRGDEERRGDRAARTLDKLRMRLAKHPLALRRLDLAAEGITKPAELARILQVDVKEVYRAIETTEYHLEKILADPSGEDDEAP